MNLAGKNFAVCGYPPLAEKVKITLANADATCNYFVSDFLTIHNTGGGGG